MDSSRQIGDGCDFGLAVVAEQDHIVFSHRIGIDFLAIQSAGHASRIDQCYPADSGGYLAFRGHANARQGAKLVISVVAGECGEIHIRRLIAEVTAENRGGTGEPSIRLILQDFCRLTTSVNVFEALAPSHSKRIASRLKTLKLICSEPLMPNLDQFKGERFYDHNLRERRRSTRNTSAGRPVPCED